MSVISSAALAASGPPRPNGQFMVGVYNAAFPADIAQAKADGFNVVHSYSFRNASGTQNPSYLTADQFVQTAANYGLGVMMQLGVLVPSEPDNPMPTAADVQHFSQYNNIVMWSVVPEENTDLTYLGNAYTTIHANDPLNRPVYMYQQTSASVNDMKNYVPVLDVIGSGLYANYAWKPRPWVRWNIGQQQQAIALNNNPPGKFVMSLPQLFPPESAQELPMTMADAYHDAWLSVICGAKAVMVFSNGYRTQLPSVYQGYKNFAQQINDSNNMGLAFLDGAGISNALPFTITSGPLMSQSFKTNPNSNTGQTIQYQSITEQSLSYNGRLYLASVNSALSPVTANFTGIRTPGATQAQVLYQNRNVSINNQAFSDSFDAEGVNIYKLPTNSQLILREDTFDTASSWSAYYTGMGSSITTSNGIATVNRGTAATQYFLESIPSGNLPKGGFLELKINAALDTKFSLELVGSSGGTTASVPWQFGTGDWETIRINFNGDWRSSNSLWLGIQGGSSYQVDSLGVYYSATPFGDFNRDGHVDAKDIKAIQLALADLNAYETQYSVPASEFQYFSDINNDGQFTNADLQSFMNLLKTGGGSESVPEPSAFMLLACGGAVTALLQRQRMKSKHGQDAGI